MDAAGTRPNRLTCRVNRLANRFHDSQNTRRIGSGMLLCIGEQVSW